MERRKPLRLTLIERSPLRQPLDWWLAVWGVVFAVVAGLGAIVSVVGFSGIGLAWGAVWVAALAVVSAIVTGVLVAVSWLVSSLLATAVRLIRH